MTTTKGINIALCTCVMDNFKYIWFPLLLFAYQEILSAQSTLSAGDLILVTVNADGDKNFDFVPLVDISANTVICFSDNAWNGSALKSSEGTLKYTAGSAVTAGTILSYSGTVSGDWSTEDAGFNPSGSGDNILVFQGSSSSPTFIYGIGWAKGTSWITNGSATANNSYIPSALSTGDNTLVSLSTKDNYQYDSSNGSKGTKSDFRYWVSQVSNYNGQNTSAYSSLSGSFTIGQAVSGDAGFRMFSSPVAGQVYDDLLSPLWTQGMTGADESSGDANVWTFNPASGAWSAISNLTTATYSAGTGVLAYVFSDVDNDGDNDLPVYLNINGTENTPTVSVSTTASEWNLLGNPFESTIDADGLFSDNSGFNTSVSVWDDASSSYKTWNGIAGGLVNGLIAPYQGFWVKAGSGDTSFDFKSNCMTGSAGTFYKTISPRTGSVVLYFESNGMKTETYFSFSSSGKLGKDKMDAYKLMPLDQKKHLTAMTFINSTAIDIINLPLQWQGIVQTPLDVLLLKPNYDGFITQEGAVKITWDLSNMIKGVSIYILDTTSHESVKLVNGDSLIVGINKKGSFVKNLRGISVYPPLGIPRFMVVFDKTNLNTHSTPSRFRFYPAYPNPFNSTTTIEFELENGGIVKMDVYNVRGQKIDSIIDEVFPAGNHSARWNGNHFPSGLYFCQLQSGSTIKVNKLVLIK